MDRSANEYRKLWENCPAHVLLYQVGTFYKIMFDDAHKLAGVLGLKLLAQLPQPRRRGESPLHVTLNTKKTSPRRGEQI